MSVINNILPSYLDSASIEEKKVFFQVLLHLSGVDGHSDNAEIEFITDAAQSQGIKSLDELQGYEDEATVLQNVRIIKSRHLAMELIREMCTLAHVDNVLSDEETLFIGKVSLTLGIEMEKIEQISNWIIDRIIWLEQAKIIFEES